jgi:hypothetical protein
VAHALPYRVAHERGFALQLLERESEMTALMDVSAINGTCAKWATYVTDDDVVQSNSGV